MKALKILLFCFLFIPLVANAQVLLPNGWELVSTEGQISFYSRSSDTAAEGNKSQLFGMIGKHGSAAVIQKMYPFQIIKKREMQIEDKLLFLEPQGGYYTQLGIRYFVVDGNHVDTICTVARNNGGGSYWLYNFFYPNTSIPSQFNTIQIRFELTVEPYTTADISCEILLDNFFTSEYFLFQQRIDRFGDPVTGIEPISSEVSKKFSLSQNYPNPFNPRTTIRFSIPKTSYTELRIYDVLGKEVATLVNENLNAGMYQTNFDSKNLTSGTYFYRLTAGDFTETKKMMLMK